MFFEGERTSLEHSKLPDLGCPQGIALSRGKHWSSVADYEKKSENGHIISKKKKVYHLFLPRSGNMSLDVSVRGSLIV